MEVYSSAFPIPANHPQHGGTSGMDLRTYIATQAMAQLIPLWHCKRPFPTEVAENAVQYADALIAELSKS